MDCSTPGFLVHHQCLELAPQPRRLEHSFVRQEPTVSPFAWQSNKAIVFYLTQNSCLWDQIWHLCTEADLSASPWWQVLHNPSGSHFPSRSLSKQERPLSAQMVSGHSQSPQTCIVPQPLISAVDGVRDCPRSRGLPCLQDRWVTGRGRTRSSRGFLGESQRTSSVNQLEARLGHSLETF